MATKKKVTEETEQAGNITGLADLKREYQLNKMPDRKLVALRTRLIELHLQGKATEDELAFMELILKRDAALGKIADNHYEVINRLEMSRCEEECIVKTADAPRVHYLVKDMKCKFRIHQEEETGEIRFIVYVERNIPSEFQMTRELVLKEQRGHFADESEYPKDRTLIHKLSLKQREFDSWFDVVEDELTKKEVAEPEYKF